jgi:hypothetical protein
MDPDSFKSNMSTDEDRAFSGRLRPFIVCRCLAWQTECVGVRVWEMVERCKVDGVGGSGEGCRVYGVFVCRRVFGRISVFGARFGVWGLHLRRRVPAWRSSSSSVLSLQVLQGP